MGYSFKKITVKIERCKLALILVSFYRKIASVDTDRYIVRVCWLRAVMSPTLLVLRCLFSTQRAARLWIFSILKASVLVWGSHTVQAYLFQTGSREHFVGLFLDGQFLGYAWGSQVICCPSVICSGCAQSTGHISGLSLLSTLSS